MAIVTEQRVAPLMAGDHLTRGVWRRVAGRRQISARHARVAGGSFRFYRLLRSAPEIQALSVSRHSRVSGRGGLRAGNPLARARRRPLPVSFAQCRRTLSLANLSRPLARRPGTFVGQPAAGTRPASGGPAVRRARALRGRVGRATQAVATNGQEVKRKVVRPSPGFWSTADSAHVSPTLRGSDRLTRAASHLVPKAAKQRQAVVRGIGTGINHL